MRLLQVSSWEVLPVERGEGRATSRPPPATFLHVSGPPCAKHVTPLPSPGLLRPKERVCAVGLCIARHMEHIANLGVDTGPRGPGPVTMAVRLLGPASRRGAPEELFPEASDTFQIPGRKPPL